jgi:hypothetical protein
MGGVVGSFGVGVAAVLLGAVVSGLLGTEEACAEEPPCGTAAPQERARLAFIANALEEEAGRARAWRWGWGGGYGVLALGQLAVVPIVEDREAHPDLFVGAAASAFGATAIFLTPSAAEGLPSCPSLADAERLLAEGAERESFGVGWLAQVGNVAVNLAVSLILGVGYHRWMSAAISGIAGLAIGELTILTKPNELVSALARYANGDFAASSGVTP